MSCNKMEINYPRPSLALSIRLESEESLKLIEEAGKLPDYDLLELRADYYKGEDLFGLLAKARLLSKKPIIFTLRTTGEGGNFKFSKAYYSNIEGVIRKGLADFVDIEAAIHREDSLRLAGEYGVKTIGSYHNMDYTESELEILKRLETMNELGFDLVKVAQYNRSYEDALRLINAGSKYGYGNGIIIGMGPYGRPTRLMDFMSKSQINFLASAEETAAGQLSLKDYLDFRRLLDL